MKIGDIICVTKDSQDADAATRKQPMWGIVNEVEDDGQDGESFYMDVFLTRMSDTATYFYHRDTYTNVPEEEVPDFVVRALARYRMTGRISSYEDR